MSPCKSYRSLQAVFNRGGYLAVQSSWVLFMSESENNRTNILIKLLCSVSEADAGIGDPRSLPDPTPIP